VKSRAVGSKGFRTRLNPGRFLIRPYALAGSPSEPLIAGLCITLLGLIFVAEVLTPDFVVAAFAILPLLAALWVLSSRLAAVVAAVAALFFGAAVAVESANRITVILLGVTVFIIALVGRFYATGLASVLSSPRHKRPTIKGSVTNGMDLRSYELRSLTRRELEVARLAAEGYTAAEIGRRLNIGDRTVESHLARAYSKLGISSRMQLIRMAAKLGAPP
jgi:DNA-binding CsgD family transcriptional regulator